QCSEVQRSGFGSRVPGSGFAPSGRAHEIRQPSSEVNQNSSNPDWRLAGPAAVWKRWRENDEELSRARQQQGDLGKADRSRMMTSESQAGGDAEGGYQRPSVAARCRTGSPAVFSEEPALMGVERLTGFIVRH